VTWRLVYTSQARKDARKLSVSGLKDKAEQLLEILKEDSYRSPPPFEKLIGDLA
jgi:toxin YoeB